MREGDKIYTECTEAKEKFTITRIGVNYLGSSCRPYICAGVDEATEN